jgi:hypothetical protein
VTWHNIFGIEPRHGKRYSAATWHNMRFRQATEISDGAEPDLRLRRQANYHAAGIVGSDSSPKNA